MPCKLTHDETIHYIKLKDIKQMIYISMSHQYLRNHDGTLTLPRIAEGGRE